MSESFIHLPRGEQKNILQTVSSRVGKASHILEKDLWICWLLKILFTIPDAHPMAFKGGTSLSKVYELIDRFSEDVDITLDYEGFGLDFDFFAPDSSRNQISKYSKVLREKVAEYVRETVYPLIREEISHLPESRQYSLDIDDNQERILFHYPSSDDTLNGYIKPRVILEFGGRNVIVPSGEHVVVPYLAEAVPELRFPAAEVTVLNPERTYWEKATLIHVACSRRNIASGANRASRHWYDLHRLSLSDIGAKAIENKVLLEDVVRLKGVFYHSKNANYSACLKKQFRLVPDREQLALLEQDYESMTSQGMLHEGYPGFDELILSLAELQDKLNS